MQAKEIKCPQCGRFTLYSTENPSRPFCSPRCKLIDLGQWADENFKIPADTSTDFNPELNSDEFNDESKTGSDDEDL